MDKIKQGNSFIVQYSINQIIDGVETPINISEFNDISVSIKPVLRELELFPKYEYSENVISISILPNHQPYLGQYRVIFKSKLNTNVVFRNPIAYQIVQNVEDESSGSNGDINIQRIQIVDTISLSTSGSFDTSKMWVALGEEGEQQIHPSHLTDATKDFITANDIPDIPTKTSELNNDSGFITLAQVPPEESFIDLWKSSASIYGGYDPATKMFNLNGLTDITYKQAIDIYQRTANTFGNDIDYRLTWGATGIRTNLPPKYIGTYTVTFNSYLSDMEVINLRPQNPYTHTTVTLSSAFNATALYANFKLKTIQGVLRLAYYTNSQPNLSYRLPMLENVQFTELKTSFAILAQAPRISLDSLTFLVNNATNGATAITVRVHADVYAKMIDSANYPDWASLLALAVSKNISFAI